MLNIYIKKFWRICGYFPRSCMLSTLINELTCGHWTTVVFIDPLVYVELTKKLICTCSPTLVLTKGTKAHQRKVSSARLIVYTAHFIRAGLDFQDRVPVLSVLGLPLDMVRARVKFWSGTDGPKSFTRIYPCRTNFFGTRTFFIRAVPKIFGPVNGALEYPPFPPPGATRVLCMSSGIHSNIQMASCQHLNLPSGSLDPGVSVPTHLQSYFDLHHPLELFLLRSALIHTSLYSLYNCLRCLLICG